MTNPKKYVLTYERKQLLKRMQEMGQELLDEKRPLPQWRKNVESAIHAYSKITFKLKEKIDACKDMVDERSYDYQNFIFTANQYAKEVQKNTTV